MGRILRAYNPFTYPGGMAGFDPSHPAAQKCLFSGIASGGGFVSRLSGAKGSVGGAPTSTIDGHIGTAATFSGASDVYNFAGESSATYPNATIGSVVIFNSVVFASQNIFCSSSGAASGWLFTLDSSGHIVFWNGASIVSSNFTPDVGVPWFIAGSIKGSAANYVFVNLLSGKTVTATSAGLATTGSPTGTYQIGNDNGSQPTKGSIAAVMFSPIYMSLPQLLEWAADPWSFWYPRAQQTVMFAGLRAPAGVVSPVVFRKTLSQIGGRVGTRQPQGWAN